MQESQPSRPPLYRGQLRARALEPLSQFLANASSLMLVEARTRSDAREHFQAMLLGDRPSDNLVKLSSRLFFTRAHACSRYWMFKRSLSPFR